MSFVVKPGQEEISSVWTECGEREPTKECTVPLTVIEEVESTRYFEPKLDIGDTVLVEWPGEGLVARPPTDPRLAER